MSFSKRRRSASVPSTSGRRIVGPMSPMLARAHFTPTGLPSAKSASTASRSRS